jgi:hypothetical protein
MRWLLGLPFVLAATLATSAVGLAGGWAITTLDDVPSELTPGVTYRVGFTVLQHGERPADGLKPAIGIRLAASGQSLEFPAQPDGTAGHYVAEVRFPAAGEWTWEVRPGGFAPQALGSVSVAAAGSGVGVVSPSTSARSSPAHETPTPWIQQLTLFRFPLAAAALATLVLFARALVSIAPAAVLAGEADGSAAR